MNSNYVVNYTTEYSDGTTYERTSKSFDNIEKAAAYAAEISRTHIVDGVFSGDWFDNYEATFIEDAPARMRITARISAV